MMKFPDGFDANMAYPLRERESSTMEDMQKIAVSVEGNLLSKRARVKAEKKTTVKEESSSMDQLLKKLEQMLEWVNLTSLSQESGILTSMASSSHNIGSDRKINETKSR